MALLGSLYERFENFLLRQQLVQVRIYLVKYLITGTNLSANIHGSQSLYPNDFGE